MEKAYDLKALGEGFKEIGLDGSEETVKKAIEKLCGWLEESAKLSKNPYDDMALVVLPKLKESALGLADKIDGKEG